MATVAHHFKAITFLVTSTLYILMGALQAMERSQDFSKILLKGNLLGMSQCGPSSVLVYGETRDYDDPGFLDRYGFSSNKEKSYDLRRYIVERVFPLNDSEMMLIYLDTDKVNKLNVESGQTEFLFKLPKIFDEHMSLYEILSDNRILFGYTGNYIKICNVNTGVVQIEFKLGRSGPSGAATDGKNRIFQVTQEQKLLTWDIVTGKCTDEIEIPSRSENNFVSGICYPGKNHIVLVWDDGLISVWNLETKKQELEFQAHDDYISSIISIGDDLYVTGGRDGLVKTWNCLSDKPVHVFEGHKNDGPDDFDHRQIKVLALLANKFVASGTNASVLISQAIKVSDHDEKLI